MIKKFKIFESYSDIERELVNQFDDDFINEYFDEHFLRTADEIIELWPNSIWKFVDDDKYIEDYIDNEINNLNIEDFCDDDYKKYIIYNISDEKEKSVLKLYNKKRKKADKETDYDDDMLDSLTENQLRKIIEDENEEEEFVKYIITDRYEGEGAQEVIEEIYGKSWVEENGRELYNMFYNYIDDDEIVEDWKNETNKRDELQENIYSSTELQKKLIEIKKSNVLSLAKLFIEEPNGDNISKEYDFQKTFIKMYVKKTYGDNGYLKANALKYLNDNFELNDDIKEEFSQYMYMVDIDKYNL